MSTQLGSSDRGVEYKDRMWPLNTDEAHLPADFECNDAASVYLFVLQRKHTGKLTSFDAFPRQTPTASAMESLMQMMLRSCQQARIWYFNDANSAKNKYPIRLYLETVFESDEAREARLDDARRNKDGEYNVRHELMRDVLQCSADEMERVTRAKSGQVDHNLTTFMMGMDPREVVEYRFWFIRAEGSIDLGGAIVNILKASFGLWDKRNTLATIEAEERNLGKQRAAIVASGELRSHVNKVSAVTTDDERWAVISSIESYANIISSYTGDDAYKHPKVIERCLDASKDLSHDSNPLNPNVVYAPTQYFKRDLRHVHAAQASIRNYTRLVPGDDERVRWRFPIPSVVIQVPSDWMNVKSMIQKFTPDYQARSVQPRISKRQVPPICLLRGSVLFAEYVAERERLAAAGVGLGATQRERDARIALAARDDELDDYRRAEVPRRPGEGFGDDSDEDAPPNVLDGDKIVVPEDPFGDNDDLSDLPLHKDYNRAWAERGALRRAQAAGDIKLIEKIKKQLTIFDPTSEKDWPSNTAHKYDEVPVDGDLTRAADLTRSRSLARSTADALSSSSSSAAAAAAPTNVAPLISLRESQKVPEAEQQRLAMKVDSGDTRTRKQERVVSEVVASGGGGGGSGVTALDTMARYYRQQRVDERRLLSDDRELMLQYTIDQDAAFAEYEDKCCSSTSAISPVGCAINRHWETEASVNRAKFTTGNVIVDERLSIFGYMMSQMGVELDKVYSVYAAHREAIVLRIASMDTYRHEYNLHLNVLLIGEAAVSKSYILELQERLSIEGTAFSVNSVTKAAANISEDRDDQMTYYQEMKGNLLCSATGPSAKPDTNIEHDQFKERIGTCRVTTEHFHSTADGHRTSILSRSSRIGNFGGATNLKFDDIAPPMISRLYTITMLPMRSESMSMAQVDAAARASAQVKRVVEMSTDATRDNRLFQLAHYHVEKLIYVGALAEPSLPVFNMYMPTFRSVLQTAFGIDVPIRTMNRLEKFLRQLVVHEALHRAYVLATSPFRGMQFNINQLKWIDPWLKDNQQMVFWLFEFTLDQYVNAHETALVEQLRTHMIASSTDVLAFQREFAGVSTGGGGGSATWTTYTQRMALKERGAGAAAAVSGGYGAGGEYNRSRTQANSHTSANASEALRRLNDAGAQSKRQREPDVDLPVTAASFSRPTPIVTGAPTMTSMTTITSMTHVSSDVTDAALATTRTAPSGLQLIAPEFQREFDFNYVRINSSLNVFAARLSGEMRTAVRPLSTEQIRDELISWTKRTLTTRRFVQNPDHDLSARAPDEAAAAGSGTPLRNNQYPVIYDPNDEKVERIFAARIDHETRTLYIASAMIYAPHKNPATAVVQACFDVHTPHGAYYMSGFQYRPDTPGLFAMRQMYQNVTKVHTQHNVAALDAPALRWLRGGKHYNEAKLETLAEARVGRSSPPWRTQSLFVLNSHIDQYAAQFRLDRIRLPWSNTRLVLRFDSMLADQLWRLKSPKCDEPAKYPEGAYADLVKANRDGRYKTALSNQRISQLHHNVELSPVMLNDIAAAQTRTYTLGQLGTLDVELRAMAKARYRLTNSRANFIESEKDAAVEMLAEEAATERAAKRAREETAQMPPPPPPPLTAAAIMSSTSNNPAMRRPDPSLYTYDDLDFE